MKTHQRRDRAVCFLSLLNVTKRTYLLVLFLLLCLLLLRVAAQEAAQQPNEGGAQEQGPARPSNDSSVVLLFSQVLQSHKQSHLLNLSFTSSSPSTQPQQPLTSSHLPRNISDYYQGTWTKLTSSSILSSPSPSSTTTTNENKEEQGAKEGEDKEGVKEDEGGGEEEGGVEKRTEKPLLPKAEFSFASTVVGSLIYQLNAKPSNVSHIDTVTGELVLRNGMWSTNTNTRFALQGLYFWKTGHLFLVANPLQHALVQNFSLALTNKTTIEDVILAADRIPFQFANESHSASDKPRLAAGSSSSVPSACHFQAVFRLERARDDISSAGHTSSDQENKPKLHLKGISYSPNCEIAIFSDASSVQFEHYFHKARLYVTAFILLTCLQVVLLINQMKQNHSRAALTKVSLMTIGIHTVMDSHLGFIHLSAGIAVGAVFDAFALAAFVNFILFSIFEMRYLVSILKARHPEEFALGWEAVRRKIRELYMRFYGGLLLGFIAIYYFNGIFLISMFIIYSMWIPQIYCNVTQCCSNAFTAKFVIGTSLIRLFIPLYFYACPYNFLHVEPRPQLASCLAAYLFFQVVILFSQDTLGPRWFIPKMLLPAKYDYKRRVEIDPEMGGKVDCVICMNAVYVTGRSPFSASSSSLRSLLLLRPRNNQQQQPQSEEQGEERTERDYDYMVTPCNHVFHSECLLRWMEFKMECPTCRGLLPYT
ncbi:DSC E3 ubiquitin ligase complex subunit 1-like [Balamuthia mandrillaris]